MALKTDKIVNNSYNSGDLNYEEFSGPMKVHDSVFSLYEDQLSDNLIEYRTLKMMETELYEIFEESPYFEKYKKLRRVDKNDMVTMFYYFKDKLVESKKFSHMEIFIGFSEFFQVNYDQLYNDIGVLDKEYLLKELSSKYGLDKKIKTKRLF
ncbi:MAG: hypothetical protein WC554_12205 [Clostridia bacterium]